MTLGRLSAQRHWLVEHGEEVWPSLRLRVCTGHRTAPWSCGERKLQKGRTKLLKWLCLCFRALL